MKKYTKEELQEKLEQEIKERNDAKKQKLNAIKQIEKLQQEIKYCELVIETENNIISRIKKDLKNM